MPRCFVIQPFDGGKFDKRFADVFDPAIKEAGLEPYRVDADPSVEIPIEGIEDGIRKAAVCLAEITSDNPNVWYELGYAFASGKPVVMVCSDERKERRFPFDIQHRAVVTYSTESVQDFNALKKKIVERLKSSLTKAEAFRQIEEANQVSPTDGLSQHELIVLSVIAGETGSPDSTVSVWNLKNDAQKVGLTAIGFSLGFRGLLQRGFVETGKESDEDGGKYEVASLSASAWTWILRNESLFMLRKTARPQQRTDDDPF